MIQISETDLPITVAQKLITATYEVTDETTKSLNKLFSGDGTKDAFSDEELMEIAEYLMVYCKCYCRKERISDSCFAAHDSKVREDERTKVLKAVIDCGWHCEVHSESALYEMVEEQLKGEQE